MTTVPQQKDSFFSFPHPINGSVARAVAAGVVIMAVATIVLEQPLITLVLAYGFIARVLAGPRLSPLAILVTKVIVPKFRLPYRPVAGPPKRFAATANSVACVIVSKDSANSMPMAAMKNGFSIAEKRVKKRDFKPVGATI